jgi:dynein heavy chain, axonemal
LRLTRLQIQVQTGNLDLIVNLYNQILQTLNDVEKPLVQQRMENIDKVMQRGLVHMNWKSHTITDFISQCTTMVKEVHGIVEVIKNNVVQTRRILESWSENLLLERKLTRTYMPDEFMALQKGLMEQRYAEIIAGSEQIHTCLGLSQKTLRATRGSNQFKAYIDHVNQILIAGLANAVQANCKHLLLQIDHEHLTKHDINPLLEVQLRLQAGFVVFSPELGRTSKGDGIADLVFQWITSFCNIGMLVRRMDTPIPEGNYLADIQENRKVKYTISVITGFINETTAACEEFRHSFEEYSHLWLDNVTQEFEDFLRFETHPGEMMPPVNAFEENIYHFRTLRDEIRELPGTKVIGWLKIDVRPLRNSLLNYVSKWSDAFQQYPLNHVIRTVHTLVDFCAGANQGISIDVIDYASLVTVLSNLLAIKKREKETDSCFEPLKLLLHMLSKHEVQIPLDLNKEVSAVQESWMLLKQKALMMKDRHAAITAKDALLLKERGKAFESKLAAFRDFFLHNMPFHYSENVDKAYATIDNLHHGQSDEHASVIGLIAEMLDINRLQECFEIDILSYDDVQICRQESVLLKCVWDAIALVIETYTKWRHIRWVDVNVKNLQDQNEWLLHHVDSLNPAVCQWNCYEELRRLMTDTHKTLPLLGALYHPSMRPRHWKQLMRATGISFETDERFCLGDLLTLKLHLYEEQVLEIVDRANKEELIERQLAELDKVWSHLNLYFDLYFDDPMTNVIRINPSLLDNLKEHITVLRQMQISKYVQTSQAQFLEKVSTWQVKLGMVDSTLVVWMDVQTKW